MMRDGIDISDMVEFLKGFVDEADLLKCIEDILKSFPINTVHNWNNGPHKKVDEGTWVPLEGAELDAYRKQNPEEESDHANKKVTAKIREKGKKQLADKSEGRDKRRPRGKGHDYKDYTNARIIKKDVLFKILELGHYSIISAGKNSEREEGDAGRSGKDSYFKRRHEALIENLNDLHVPFFRAIGNYGEKERSVFVLHEDHPLTKKEMEGKEPVFMVSQGKKQDNIKGKLEKMATMFNQDSVIHANSGNDVELVFTTQPKEGPPRENIKAKPVTTKSKQVWRDVTGASKLFTKVRHPEKAHTQFSFNFFDETKNEEDAIQR